MRDTFLNIFDVCLKNINDYCKIFSYYKLKLNISQITEKEKISVHQQNFSRFLRFLIKQPMKTKANELFVAHLNSVNISFKNRQISIKMREVMIKLWKMGKR